MLNPRGGFMLKQGKAPMLGEKYNAPTMTKNAVAVSIVKIRFGLPREIQKVMPRKLGNGSINVSIQAEVRTMTEYEFVLRFQLPADTDLPEEFLDALYEAGCDDAVVGVGLPGYISLDFSREATDAQEAVLSAISHVQNAIHNAKLIEVSPDLLNTSEIADLVSARVGKITRQAMRKYTCGQVTKVKSRFPAAAVNSSSPLWHVDEVVSWLIENKKTSNQVNAMRLIEISKVARAMNVQVQWQAVKDLMPNLKVKAG